MLEQATPAQIKALQKLKLHPTPWELSKQEAWQLMDEHFNKKNGNEPNQPSAQPQKTYQKPSTKEFHLSPEQVNTNALMAAIETAKGGIQPDGSTNLLDIAKEFKEFIENGN